MAVAIGFLVLAGCSSGDDSAQPEPTSTSTSTTVVEPVSIIGTLTTLRSGDYHFNLVGELPQIVNNGGSCGFGETLDGDNTQIIVESRTGEIIGVGTFGEGKLIGIRNPEGVEVIVLNFGRNATKSRADCELPFAVELSSESPFYTIGIEGADGLTYSHDELESTGWIVSITLGWPPALHPAR